MLDIFARNKSHCKIYISIYISIYFYLYFFWIFHWELGNKITKFINFVEVGGELGLKDLAEILSSFLSSMSSTNGFQKSQIRFSQNSLTKGIVFCSTNNNTFNEGVSKIFEFTISA